MMGRRIDTEIYIDANPASVWHVLTDFPAYPDWNPFIRTIEGQAIQGTRLSVSIQPQGGKPMRFCPEVKAADDAARFSWTGRVLMRGLFDGHHEFELHSHGHGTRLLHRECFSGLLVPLVWNKMEPSTRAGFEAMNRALKERAETPTVKD
jgi:hypothetical protein